MLRLTDSPLVRLSSACFIGLCSAFSYYMHFLQTRLSTPGEQILLLMYLTGLFAALAYFLLFRFAVPRLQILSRRVKVAWVVVSCLIGIFLLIVIPVHLPSLASQHRLEIVATGQKNPASQGSEVWVTGLFLNNGTQVDTADFQLDGKWEMRNGVPLSYQQQPATLRWQGMVDGDVKLRLLSHPWSGVVAINWDGVSQTVDLYAESGTQKDIILPAGAASPGLPSLVFAADAITMGMLVVVISIWLATRPIKLKTVPVRRWSWVAYALPCIATWSVYLLAFWPGLMSPDSLDQWNQVLTGHLNDAHPAFHTLTIWLATRLILSPAIVAIVQIVALSIVFGMTIHELEYWGVPVGIRLIITALFALSPINGLMVITLWKDIAYTIALFGIFSILLHLVRTNGAWLHSPSHMAIFCGALVCTAAYRHNGLPVAILLIGVLLVWLKPRSKRLRILGIATATLIVYVVIVGPVYSLLNVAPMSPLFASQELVHQVGSVVQEKETFSESDSTLLAGIQPLAIWKSTYSCYTLNPLIYNGAVNSGFFDAHAVQFVELWFRYMIQNPESLLRHQGCVSSMIWRITQDSGGYLDTAPYTGIQNNSSGIISDSQLPLVQGFLIRLAEQTRKAENIWWTWRPAIYLYLTLFVVIVTAIRIKRKSILTLALPSVLNSLVLLALITVQDFRFQYPVYVIGLVVPALLFIHTRLEHQATQAPASE